MNPKGVFAVVVEPNAEVCVVDPKSPPEALEVGKLPKPPGFDCVPPNDENGLV